MKITKCCSGSHLIFFAVCAALVTGFFHSQFLDNVAAVISEIFLNLLKFISIPLIFLSIVSTVSNMENLDQFKTLGKKVFKYTLLTTFIASLVALTMFLIIDPVKADFHFEHYDEIPEKVSQGSYLTYFIKIFPSNIFQPFLENQVVSVLFIALICSIAILGLPEPQKHPLKQFFSSFYAMIMKITGWIVICMPLAIWSFITIFIRDVREGLNVSQIALYLSVVIISNLIQGFIILPTFLKLKGISPFRIAKGMMPALSLAFFSKSSSATLPMAMQCAKDNLGIDSKTTNFTFPLCTTINMNACAAFILTTVLFVSSVHGITYGWFDYGLWTVIATIAALGNAGVPMGCFFLSSALLASLDVPLILMGVILPFYTIIDMLETALNVWSDSCVVAVVDNELKQPALEKA